LSSRLEANAILLCDGSTKILFIAADVLYIGPDLDRLIRSCAAGNGIEESHVVLSASHTHFAPATDMTKPRLGGIDESYLSFLTEKLLALVNSVISVVPAKVRLELVGLDTDGININRRRWWPLPVLTKDGVGWPPNVAMAPNTVAHCDRSLEALRVLDEDHNPIAVFWKFACHPVSYPDSKSISSEYPGVAREALRKFAGKDIPIVFWQGFCGDVRPALIGPVSWKERVRSLRRGPTFGEGIQKDEWVAWSNRIAAALVSAVTMIPGEPVTGELTIASARVPLASLLDGNANPLVRERSMLIQRLTFDGQLAVLFMAAEVCSPYQHLLNTGMRTIYVGYTGDVFGYLPSAEQAAGGGYEATGFFARFSLVGSLLPGFEQKVIEAARGLIDAAR
jgi:hypothetical protein